MSDLGHSRRSQHTRRWSGLLPIAAVPSAAANRRNGPIGDVWRLLLSPTTSVARIAASRRSDIRAAASCTATTVRINGRRARPAARAIVSQPIVGRLHHLYCRRSFQ
jgi:hypothetical protein